VLLSACTPPLLGVRPAATDGVATLDVRTLSAVLSSHCDTEDTEPDRSSSLGGRALMVPC